VVLNETPKGIVIFNLLNPSKPLIIEESVLLDKSCMGVWFVSQKEWHDIGAIYDRHKGFKGYYCDICTPIKKTSDGYEMTDFFIDLWVFPDGRFLVLDQDEFDRAVEQRWISPDQTAKVKAELENLVSKVKSSRFPTSAIKDLLKLPRNTDEIIHTLEAIKESPQKLDMFYPGL